MDTRIYNFLHHRLTIPTAVAAIAFATGSGVGYFLGKKNGDVFIIPKEVVEENPQMVLFDDSEKESTLHVEMEMAPEEVIISEELITAADVAEFVQNRTNYSGIASGTKAEPDVAPEAKLVNVFRKAQTSELTEWNWEEEVNSRTADAPYVITHDEFMQADNDYIQSTVTYYAGDDVMADELDTPIYGYNALMGELKFGHGSNDPTVVYIRNDHLHMEWEVLHHRGSFEIEVLGHTFEAESERQELRHANSVRKFRDD